MSISEEQNLPDAFKAQMQQLLPRDEYALFEQALGHTSSVSIRKNLAKQPLQEAHVSADVPWCSSGHYLTERCTFTFDPLWHAGNYYVQEASSMFVAQALQQYISGDVVALDLCAAPGGKSTLLRSYLSPDSLLISNEVIRSRAQILAENMTKWGHPNTVVTQNDPADFKTFAASFQLIVADVPCSGEGMFRKDPNAIAEWSPTHVTHCVQRQRRILTDIWESLAPGGLLIYSTCTYNTAENEENVTWIAEELGATVLPIAIDDAWKITGNLTPSDAPVYRFMPHKTQGEGLFLAVLRKNGEAESIPSLPILKKKKHKRGQKVEKEVIPNELKNWLSSSESYVYHQHKAQFIAFPKLYEHLWEKLKSLHLLQAGVNLATQKGKNLIPSQALAFSTACSVTLFPRYELSYTEAIVYLRKEALVLSQEVPVGYVLVTYAHQPLGFVKNIGRRANNLYPNEWRIRSGYLPEEIKCLYR